ncbi:hypothetical protein BCB68_05155 [Leptotrichia sp. oral taxon 498]|uniref:YopX family protein n=1 Tax=Leptotrichia sp. oral taxon 498 TaxID=712368 RepID=UPI000B8C9DF8|nr:YopX family protein [Leptotrichia sp. oral taxon 498]ASQ48368.1 hypothetical protein BCB68_05155 [Leptotrichia sp. oral taxon 498]
MSKEIKFRAWLKEDKKMENVKTMDFTDKTIRCLKKNEFINAYLLRRVSFDDVELMQYTGLKDKNSKEIYEGDIVLVKPGGISTWYKTVVKFKEGAFIASLIDGENYIYIFNRGFDSNDFEILGNIYENLELLEENK